MKLAMTMMGLVTAGALAGCGAIGGGAGKAGEQLDDSIRVYNDGMRWQRYDSAASRIPARERATFVDEWDERSKDLKITDYDVIAVEHKGKQAKVQIKMSWYSESEGTLHETSATQIWEHHGQAWFMVDETRLRGKEMPGLAERAPKQDKDGKDLKGTQDAKGSGDAAPTGKHHKPKDLEDDFDNPSPDRAGGAFDGPTASNSPS